MPLPETIPVSYTEEEAGYISVRPILRQTFRLYELLDMILSVTSGPTGGVTGKDAGRVRQILRSGTIAYHFYRYSWTGFDPDETELAAALAQFPDAEPARPFAPGQCIAAVFQSGGVYSTNLLELDRAAGSMRRMFRGKSFWERLLEIAGDEKISYHGYSYERRADLYLLELNGENKMRIALAANRLARRNLRTALRVLPEAACVLFVCPR
ncbi:MAG TPA: hypothetical protein VNI36_00635 [Candidatus Dormibacteraeota bacterium]|nr:hypothetical protein [Candidatus Dormibacteraeota bacterium]